MDEAPERGRLRGSLDALQAHRLVDELMALSNAVPLAEESVAELAPEIVRHIGGGSPAEALDRMRRDFTANLHIKEWAAACASLGFDDRVNDPSKQQRLSDLAEHYGRTGWRNMYRWSQVAFEYWATRYATMGQARDLFDVILSQSADAKTFDLRINYFEREAEDEWVDRVEVIVDHHLQMLWKPVGDDTVVFLGLTPTGDREGFSSQITVRVMWHSNARGPSHVVTRMRDEWAVFNTVEKNSVTITAVHERERDEPQL